jgi:hypothetical protein
MMTSNVMVMGQPFKAFESRPLTLIIYHFVLVDKNYPILIAIKHFYESLRELQIISSVRIAFA